MAECTCSSGALVEPLQLSGSRNTEKSKAGFYPCGLMLGARFPRR
jgi:hypothetical protein